MSLSYSSSKASELNLIDWFTHGKESMKSKVKEIITQATSNLAELAFFLVISHKYLNDPQYAYEITPEALEGLDVWHNELLNSCYNFKRVNFRHITDFKFTLGGSKLSEALFLKLDKLTDSMRTSNPVDEIMADNNKLRNYLWDIVRIIECRVGGGGEDQPPISSKKPNLVHSEIDHSSIDHSSNYKQHNSLNHQFISQNRFGEQNLDSVDPSNKNELGLLKSQKEYKSSTLYECGSESKMFMSDSHAEMKCVLGNSDFNKPQKGKECKDPKKYQRHTLKEVGNTSMVSSHSTRKSVKPLLQKRQEEVVEEENKENKFCENYYHSDLSLTGKSERSNLNSKEIPIMQHESKNYLESAHSVRLDSKHHSEFVHESPYNYATSNLREAEMVAYPTNQEVQTYTAERPVFASQERKLYVEVPEEKVETTELYEQRIEFRNDQKFEVESMTIKEKHVEVKYDHATLEYANDYKTNQYNETITFNNINFEPNFVSNTSEQNKMLKNFLTFSNMQGHESASKELPKEQKEQPVVPPAALDSTAIIFNHLIGGGMKKRNSQSELMKSYHSETDPGVMNQNQKKRATTAADNYQSTQENSTTLPFTQKSSVDSLGNFKEPKQPNNSAQLSVEKFPSQDTGLIASNPTNTGTSTVKSSQKEIEIGHLEKDPSIVGEENIFRNMDANM